VTSTYLLARVLVFIPVVLSLGAHEWAHARAALALGDDTAEKLGRLTLNPLAHLDPLGTLLPLLGFPLGWAKPVPINPNRFRTDISLGLGLVLTAAAGPLANFVLAALCLVATAAASQFAPEAIGRGSTLALLLTQGLFVNLTLGVFNLLPIPPLDGSRIVDGLLPFEWRGPWQSFSRYGGVVLVLLLFVAPLLGVHLFDWISTLGYRLLRAARNAG
jgi:Zn-dependent protease